MRAEAKKPIKSRKTGAKLYASTVSRLPVARLSSASAKFHPHLSRPCQNPGNLWFSRVFSVFRLNNPLVLPGVHTKAWKVLILQRGARRFLQGTSQLQKGRGKRKELVCQVRSQPCRESSSASASPSGVCAGPLFLGGFDSMPAVFWKRAWGGLSCLFCGKVGDGSHMVREFPLEKGMASLFSGKNTRPSSVFPV